MATSKHEGDLFVNGNLRATSMTLPPNTVQDANVPDGAGIKATKLEQQYELKYGQDDGSDIVAATSSIHVVRGVSGLVVEVEVVSQTAPTGGDKQFTVDVLTASQAAPSPSSVLQAVITVDSAIADYEVVQGIVDAGTLADGDTIIVVVTPSGSTGSQGQGLVVTVTIREAAE